MQFSVTPEPRTEPRPFLALGPNEGEHVWFLDQLVVVKQRGADAPYGLIETELDAGRGTPFHRHTGEDEAFYVLDGALTLYLEGGRTLSGLPGSYVHLPRGVAHGFRTHTRTRLLVLSAPTGFVDFTREYGVPAPEAGLPPAAEPDFARLERLARKYQIELLGPLPA
jgi:quercetin dioxygenase-like cupin family protein